MGHIDGVVPPLLLLRLHLVQLVLELHHLPLLLREDVKVVALLLGLLSRHTHTTAAA